MKLETFSKIIQTHFGISENIVNTAKLSARKKGESLSDTLIKKKIITENSALSAYEILYDIPFQADLDARDIDFDFTKIIPIRFLKKYYIVPLIKKADQDGTVQDTIIAINDPSSIQAVDDLVSLLKIQNFRFVLSTKEKILFCINNFYDKKSGSAQQIVNDMEDDDSIIRDIKHSFNLLDDTSDVPIINLMNHVISQSVKAKASDIHIEPGRENLKIRYRVDGVLYDLLELPKWIQSSLVIRIKVMADMNIAEKRLPQDSRIELVMGNKEIDIRVATMPTAHGERVVLRLLDKSNSMLTLSKFGIAPKQLKLIRSLFTQPNGIILITGPTGSGKTTTLYAMLSELNNSGINIITVEDPVEYKLEGINQIQVNSKIGLTFIKTLRSIVRQDPDIILIGEMRDSETASIAVQSALTGHLVLSTLHTNDSATAITRLVDIGIESFLITSTVRSVISQRLVRVLCNDCKEQYIPDAIALNNMGFKAKDFEQKKIFRAKGCKKCFHTGYKGRMPIFEILILSDHLKSLILKTSDSTRINQLAVDQGMTTIFQDGMEKVFQGITTIEEILRVTKV